MRRQRKSKSPTVHSSFRLRPDAKRQLEKLSQVDDVSQAAVLDRLIREEAERRKIR